MWFCVQIAACPDNGGDNGGDNGSTKIIYALPLAVVAAATIATLFVT